jgi:hypothetical protein
VALRHRNPIDKQQKAKCERQQPTGAADQEEGRMSDAPAVAAAQAGDSPVVFRFAYRTVPFRVVMNDTAAHKQAGGRGVMLYADVGTMPFTVEGPSLRSRMLAVLARARRMPGIDVQVTPDRGISLAVTLAVEDAAQPASVLAAAIARLVEAKPLLDVVLSLLPTHLQNRAEHPRSAA